MNIEHARTFLAVADTGSFVSAAERLNVTQSTVSARIRSLEVALSAKLFVRSKSGSVLTAPGVRFVKHAAQMVITLERAQQDVGLPRQFLARVVIGARFGLWAGATMDWFAGLREYHPSVSLRAEIGFEPELMHGLIEGRIDIGIMFTPQRRPNLEMHHFIDESLVMVRSDKNGGKMLESYVHVDWGPEFDNQFRASFPEHPGFAITVNVGWLGLQYLKRNGGCGYFPRRLVQCDIASKTLHLVREAPVFDLPAWLLIRVDRDKSLIDPLVQSLADHYRRQPA